MWWSAALFRKELLRTSGLNFCNVAQVRRRTQAKDKKRRGGCHVSFFDFLEFASRELSRDNEITFQADFQLGTFVQLHIAAFEHQAAASAEARACRSANRRAFAAAEH